MKDNTFYYKTSSCDDVNPRDMSHVCFLVNESYRVANCSEDEQPVICYLFSPSLIYRFRNGVQCSKFLIVSTHTGKGGDVSLRAT